MSKLLQSIWQLNIELSLLLLAVLLARLAIRKTTKVYNAYLLWLSIPVGLILAKLSSLAPLSEPPIKVIHYAAQNYVAQPSYQFEGWTSLGMIWLVVTFALIARLLGQHISLRRELKGITVQSRFKYAAKYPVISIDKTDFSPAVYGFTRPKIYFPIQLQSELDDHQIRLIIRHEEHHITQHHLWLNLLWDLAVCIFWFNPLIYVSRQGFRHDQELFCDYLVLDKSTQRDHQSYGHALLSTVSATHSVSLLCSWKTVNLLEERIMNIKQSTNVKTKLIGKIAIGIFATSIVGCTSLYAVSANEYGKDPKLSQSKDYKGNTESIIRIGDKSYVEENGERYVVEAGDQRLMNEEENTEFDRLIEKSKNNNKDSLTHSVDDNGEKITWRKGDTHFIEENGKRYVIEDNDTRSMNDAEQKKFEETIKLSKRESKQYRKALKKAEAKYKRMETRAKDQSSLTPDKELRLSSADKFEKVRSKAKADVIKSYKREFEKAKLHITASQQEIKQLQKNGQISDEHALSLLESLSESKAELDLQKKYLQQRFSSKQRLIEEQTENQRGDAI